MQERIQKIQKFLKKGEALIVFSRSNRFYLTDFCSSAGVVVLTGESAVFLVDFRYFEKARAVVKTAEVRLCSNTFEQIRDILKRESIKQVFLETDSVDLALFSKLSQTLSDIKVSKDGLAQAFINKMRAVKSQAEIESIKKAQALTDKAFSYILQRISKGRTEREIALELEFFMRSNGSDGVAFDTIAVSGKNSSLPHGVPTEKPLQNGDFLTMDFGARIDGYCSDMTRTVAIGNISEKQQLVYDTVLNAQTKAFEKIKPQTVCKEVDFAARDYINKSGFENCFGHGLGHSVGIDIHESPSFNMRDETLLECGMVLTVEPGIYLENEFGVRIEDMVVITENGYENLTRSSKKLIIM